MYYDKVTLLMSYWFGLVWSKEKIIFSRLICLNKWLSLLSKDNWGLYMTLFMVYRDTRYSYVFILFDDLVGNNAILRKINIGDG